MDEYIKREEAVKKIKSCIFTAEDAWESGYNTAMAEIMEWIKHIPAADVQPVKHGKWIEKKVCRIKWIPYDDDDVNPDDVDIECMTEQKCSYCKRWTIKFTYHIELDYCPLCGARMDGDSE